MVKTSIHGDNLASETPLKENMRSNLLVKILIFLAFAIPIVILEYVFYINYLPFGYEETFTLKVDEGGIISPLSNEIYLATPKGRKLLSLPEGVQGQVNLVLDPKVVLKDATINIELKGKGVFLGTPLAINFSNVVWGSSWDFTQDVPSDLQGTAEFNEDNGCVYFDAYKEQTLSLPNSQDMFEFGSMSIYVKWKPSEISRLSGNSQQIVGHYNWEIWQDEEKVQFRVGRMNNANGSAYSINYPINSDFFGQEHEALAVYSPDVYGNGYIEFWVDNNLAGRTLINADTIYREYNSDKPLSFGWSPHNFGNNPYYDGCIYDVKIANSIVSQERSKVIIKEVNGSTNIPVIGNGIITSITLKVEQ